MDSAFHTQNVSIPLWDPDELGNSESQPEVGSGSDQDDFCKDTTTRPPKAPSRSKAKRNRKQNKYNDSNQVSQPTLRPASDILSRIRHDPDLDETDYIVGYHDRHEPEAVEMAVSAWKGGGDVTDEEWIPQHRTLYFRKDSDGELVWHRGQRLDKLFGSGIQNTADKAVEEANLALEKDGSEPGEEPLMAL